MAKSKPLSFKYIVYDLVRITGSPGILFFRPKKLYLTEEAKKWIKGGALIISNHITLSDPMYLMLTIWYRRHHFVAMKQLFEGKFKRWLFTKAFMCLEIDRDNFSIKTFKNIVDHLKSGEVVTTFPEGHVNVEKEGTQSFKSGMVMMALKSGCPIIPVYIKRRKHWYSRLVLGVGEPVDIKKFASGDKPTIAEIDDAAKYLEEEEHKLELLCNGRELNNGK